MVSFSLGNGPLCPETKLTHTQPKPKLCCLLELGTDSLSVIVVLGHHPSKILISLNPLKYIAVDRELLAEGQ